MNQLFNDIPEPSNELQWMLQSGAASDEVLANALVSAEYPRLYRLAAAMGTPSTETHNLVVDVLAQVLLTSGEYRAETDLPTWMDRLLVRESRSIRRRLERKLPFLESGPASGAEVISHKNRFGQPYARPQDRIVWPAIDTLPDGARVPLVFNLIGSLELPAIAHRLGENPESTRQTLEDGIQSLVLALEGSQLGLLDLAKTIGSSLAHRYPEFTLDTAEQNRIAGQVIRKARGGKDRGHSTKFRKEFALGGIALLLIVAFLRFGNLMIPANPARIPQVITVLVTKASSSKRVVVATPQAALPKSETLYWDSPVSAVRDRMLESQDLWKSLWADALVIHYGPKGYFGPPLVTRRQVWVEKPGHVLTLSGPASGEAQFMWVRNWNRRFSQDLTSGQVLYDIESGIPEVSDRIQPFVPVTGDIPPSWQTLDGFYLSDLSYPRYADLPLDGLRITGSEKVAGRSTLVLQWRPPGGQPSAKLWVDASNGVILRWRRYDLGDPSLVTDEVILTEVAFDVTFPSNFFPRRGLHNRTLEWDDLWKPEIYGFTPYTANWQVLSLRDPQARIAPPAGFDPAQSQLSFQWPERVPPAPAEENLAEIFADQYFIGEMALGDPWKLSCVRSPDGRLLAFIPDSNASFSPEFAPRWLDLARPTRVRPLLTSERTGSHVAFSPDSRFLAFHGCMGEGQNCAVYRLDTQSRREVKLLDIQFAGLFAWSPDGRELAFYGLRPWTTRIPEWLLIVLDVQTGKETYAHGFDFSQPDLPPDAPAWLSEVGYPPKQPGMHGCLGRVQAYLSPYKTRGPTREL